MDLTKKELLREIKRSFDQAILDGVVDINMKEYHFLLDVFGVYFEKFSKPTLQKIHSGDFTKILHKFKEMDFDNIELLEGEKTK